MSRRHQDGIDRPNRSERKRTNRTARHQAALALRSMDPDEVVPPRPVHTAPEHTGPPRSGPRRIRHWKTKDWKRRTTLRQQRATQLQALRNL